MAELERKLASLAQAMEEKERQIAELRNRRTAETASNDEQVYPPGFAPEQAAPERVADARPAPIPAPPAAASVATLSVQQLQEMIANAVNTQRGGTIHDVSAYSKPYTRRIDDLRMPTPYQPPKFQQFDGKGNPRQHVAHFVETCNNAGTYGDLLVKQFVRSLKGNAFDWYVDMLPESIDSWGQLEREFLNRFFSTRRTVSMMELTNTHQGVGEPVVDYINRWRALSLDCKDRLGELSAVEMCVQGMEYDLLYILQGIRPRSFEELATRAHDMEVSVLARKGKKPSDPEPKEDFTRVHKPSVGYKEVMAVDAAQSRPMRIKQKSIPAGSSSQPRGKVSLRDRLERRYPFPDTDVPDMLEQLLQMKLIELPETRRPEEKDKTGDPNFCGYHRALGHPTGKCFVLKDQILTLQSQGKIDLDNNAAETNNTSVELGESQTKDAAPCAEDAAPCANDEAPYAENKEMAPRAIEEANSTVVGSGENLAELELAPRAIENKAALHVAVEEEAPRAENEKAALVAENDEAAPVAENDEAAPDAENEGAAPDAESERAAPVVANERAAPDAENAEAAPVAENEKAPRAEEEEVVPRATEAETAPCAEIKGTTPCAEIEMVTPRATKEAAAPRGKIKEWTASHAEIVETATHAEVGETAPCAEVEVVAPCPTEKATVPRAEAEKATASCAGVEKVAPRAEEEVMAPERHEEEQSQETLANSLPTKSTNRPPVLSRRIEDKSSCEKCRSAITFSDADLLLGSKPHNRPLYVTGLLRGQSINRMLVDGGSAVNIMPKATMKELGIGMDELSKSRLMIQGFNQGGQRAVGMIRLDIRMGDLVTSTLLHVIDARTTYRVLLGRPWIHESGVVPSSLHQCFFYFRDGPKKVCADVNPFTEAEAHIADAKFYFAEDVAELTPNFIPSTGGVLPKSAPTTEKPKISEEAALVRASEEILRLVTPSRDKSRSPAPPHIASEAAPPQHGMPTLRYIPREVRKADQSPFIRQSNEESKVCDPRNTPSKPARIRVRSKAAESQNITAVKIEITTEVIEDEGSAPRNSVFNRLAPAGGTSAFARLGAPEPASEPTARESVFLRLGAKIRKSRRSRPARRSTRGGKKVRAKAVRARLGDEEEQVAEVDHVMATEADSSIKGEIKELCKLFDSDDVNVGSIDAKFLKRYYA